MSYENVIYVNKYDANDTAVFPVNKQEVWRYSGYLGLEKSVSAELDDLLETVTKELEGVFQFKICYRRMPLVWKDGKPLLPFSCESKDLSKCLDSCDEIVLFAATVGLEIDRKIARYERFSPSKALLMHAYGAERVETLCNHFCNEIQKEIRTEGLSCSPRFSPGYGDLPLETQREFFQLMDCNRKIGISLNESLLMTPSKSVTAIFGIGPCTKIKVNEATHKCSECVNTDCEYRKV